MGILNLTAALACIVTALLTIGLCVPALRLESDWTIINGVQRPAGFTSDEAWGQLNRFAARRMIVWSLPVLGLGIAALFVPMEGQPWLALLFGIAPLLILRAVWETVQFVRQDESKEEG